MILILLLVIATSATSEKCPISCECRDFPRENLLTGAGYTTVTCDGNVNFTTRLPETTQRIILNDVLESDLSYVFDFVSSVSSHLPYFSHLVIKDSDLQDISNVSLDGLANLQSLQITNSHLTGVPFTLFNLSSLQVLDVSHNELKVIPDEEFRTFSVLEVLNLSANSIDAISPGSFSGLTILKCLDLTENNLTALDDKALRPLISLQHLNLSKNRLEVLNEACFSSLLHLQQLDVSWNRLARVAPGSLELPSLARLMLAGNPKLGGSREPALLVGTGRRLQTVDASRTGLKQVPAALTHSIRTLRLAGNSIRLVKCGDLDSYPLLQLLDFTSNELEEIEDDALGRLESLSVLYLTDNKLHTIPKSLPERLRILHLEHNQVQQINEGDLDGLPLLEVLLLSNNKISAVKESAFTGLGSLATLDLSRNPLTLLPPGSLSGPRELRVLKLAGIEIISPAKDMAFPLSTPEHLVTLDLSQSPGLARQLLADTATLAAARELQELNLSAGGLEHIRSDLLHFLPQLRKLELENNPINCSDIQWLAVWMRRQDEDQYRKVVCSSPPELWGTLLVDLQDIESEPKYETTAQSINQTRLPEAIEEKTSSYGKNKLNNTVTYNINLTKVNSSLQSGETASPSLPDGISAYNASGSAAKLSKMSDDEVSAKLNLITEDVTTRSEISTQGIAKEIMRETEKYVNNTVQNAKNASEVRAENKKGSDVIAENSKSETSRLKNVKSNLTGVGWADGRRNRENLSESGNVLHKAGGIQSSTEIPHNLFIVSKGKALNKKVEKPEDHDKNMNEIYPVQNGIGKKDGARKSSNIITSQEASTTVGANLEEHQHGENVTLATGEMSMYSGEYKGRGLGAHPGMLVLAIGILAASAVMAVVTSRIAKQRRLRLMARQQEDIEVSSLPSVTELW